MAKEVMARNASENKYLCKVFHNILNLGLEYLRENYGDEAVREYLTQYANAFYVPLKQHIDQYGLTAIKEYFQRVYEAEEFADAISFSESSEELIIQISRCPAVTFLRENGKDISPIFIETTRVIGEALCEGSSFAYSLESYDDSDGASVQRFYRKENLS